MKNKFKFVLLSIILLASCTSIPTLMEEPKAPILSKIENNFSVLLKYETELNNYVMYLMEFLSTTKKQVQDKEFPKFDYFDTSTLKLNTSVVEIEYNINLYKKYITITKPIAENVYKKYSKVYNLKR